MNIVEFFKQQEMEKKLRLSKEQQEKLETFEKIIPLIEQLGDIDHPKMIVTYSHVRINNYYALDIIFKRIKKKWWQSSIITTYRISASNDPSLLWCEPNRKFGDVICRCNDEAGMALLLFDICKNVGFYP